MKTKHGNVAALFLAIVFAVSLLAGCGSSTSNPGDGTTAVSGADQQATSAANSAKPTEISYTSWRVEDIDPNNQLIAEFEKDHPEVKVVFNPIKDMEYDAQLRTKLESGTADDVLGIRAFDIGKAIYDAGYLKPLTSDDVPEIANTSKLQLSAWTADDGTIYGLPGNWVANGFLYNTEIFDQYGLKPPKTWDEFFKVCDTLKANGVTAIAGSSKEPWVLIELVSANIGPNFYGGETWRKAMLEGKDDFSNAGFIEHLSTIKKMSEYFPKGYESFGYFEAQQYFANGQAAIIPEGSWAPANILSQNPDIKIDFFQAPVKNEGDNAYVGMTPALAYGVNKSSKNQEAIMTFLKWLASPKGAQLQNKLLPGLFCSMPDSGTLDDPLMNKWFASVGDNTSNGSIYWTYEKVQSKQPGAGDLAGEAIIDMLNGKMTPEQAAKHIQDGLASWYGPLKK